MLRKSIFFCTFFLLWPLISLGSPAIVSLSGDTIDKNLINISGGNFGNVSLNVEWTSENVEFGVPGEDFYKTGWSNYYNAKAKYSNEESHSGNNSILFHFLDTVYATALVFKNETPFTQCYFTAWIKLKKNDNNYIYQWKIWRVKSNPGYGMTTIDADNETGVIGDPWYRSHSWGNYVTPVSDMKKLLDSRSDVSSDAFEFDKWQRIEAFYKKSDTNSSNGEFWWRRVGRPGNIAGKSQAMTHTGLAADALWQYVMIGHYYGNLTPGTERNMKIFFDDFFFNTTQARIEIGNMSTWDASTHREIQIPSAWSDQSISFSFNQGSFADGETVYLYVVDANGNFNNTGYPITIGSLNQEIPPTEEPTPPVIQNITIQ